MDLQQRQIDELASWLTSAESKIELSEPVGSDVETIKRQIDEHKVVGTVPQNSFTILGCSLNADYSCHII